MGGVVGWNSHDLHSQCFFLFLKPEAARGNPVCTSIHGSRHRKGQEKNTRFRSPALQGRRCTGTQSTAHRDRRPLFWLLACSLQSAGFSVGSAHLVRARVSYCFTIHAGRCHCRCFRRHSPDGTRLPRHRVAGWCECGIENKLFFPGTPLLGGLRGRTGGGTNLPERPCFT